MKQIPHAPQRISHAKRISRTKCISQIPLGIYFVEKSTHCLGRQMCAFFWRRQRDSFLVRAKHLRFNLRSCFALTFGHRSKTLPRSIFSLRSNPFFIPRIKKRAPDGVLFLYGGGRGIRTPVGFHPNGFQGTLTTRKLENFRGR